MDTIHVVGGVGVAPTEMAAYDAALAEGNLHNYNLVGVSSVIPAGATVRVVDSAPDLGPAGNRLTVVQGMAVVGPDSTAEEIAAVIGWATGPGPGLFYEAAGEEPAAVERAVDAGLDAGCALREWSFTDRETLVSRATPVDDAYTAVVVVAAYGESEPVL
jgi:arginine decarboxylase